MQFENKKPLSKTVIINKIKKYLQQTGNLNNENFSNDYDEEEHKKIGASTYLGGASEVIINDVKIFNVDTIYVNSYDGIMIYDASSTMLFHIELRYVYSFEMLK